MVSQNCWVAFPNLARGAFGGLQASPRVPVSFGGVPLAPFRGRSRRSPSSTEISGCVHPSERTITGDDGESQDMGRRGPASITQAHEEKRPRPPLAVPEKSRAACWPDLHASRLVQSFLEPSQRQTEDDDEENAERDELIPQFPEACLPFNRMPRLSRLKCVSGKASASH